MSVQDQTPAPDVTSVEVTPASRDAGAIVFRRTGGPEDVDAINDYSEHLVAALGEIGVPARYAPHGLSAVLRATDAPAWILLQYNPFRYGRSGFAPRLLLEARRLRRERRVPLAVMVHEAWVDITDARSALIGGWQRAQLRDLLRLTDRVMTSTEALAREIGGGAVHVPIASNILPAPVSRDTARRALGLEDELVVALFGTNHPSRALAYAEDAIAALATTRGADRLVVLNLGAGAPALAVPESARCRTPGALSAKQLSLHLRAADIALLPFADGLSTRRTTLMASLAHAVPVLGLLGRNTDAALVNAADAVALAPVGDRRGFARVAVELTSDAPRLRALGDAGRDLYRSRFDWPVLAERVSVLLEEMRATRSRRIVYVAHTVGGSGGTERHCERMVNGLLDAGRHVTVVARSCAVEPRPGLTFARVRTPRRPFVMAYPAFFVAGSRAVARHKGALVHTTGAVVANRADVSTVHYCHRAAARRVDGTRASRPTLPYRLNAEAATVLKRAAEAWCYRSARTQMLCAVSSGVADELREGFPSMRGALYAIPNGVDAGHFRPDPDRRGATRAQLGIGDDVPLALFAGGDWTRKGLAWAIRALALAPRWHLAVAGPGDRDSALTEARRAGAERRLHLLGAVDDMPAMYAAADAFVLPTAYEAFPLVILEAAASGVPLLVARVNGAEELLEHGVNGWFVERDDRDIADRLNVLVASPELAAAMSDAARVAAQRYTWEAMIARYLAIYDTVATPR